MSDGSLDDIEAELEERVAAIHRYEPLYGVALIQLVVYRGMRSLFTRTELLADRIEAGPNANAIAKAIAPRLAGRLDTTATFVSISAAILLSAAAASVTDRVVSAGYEARLADTRSVIGSLPLADAEALAKIVRLNPPIAAMIEHGVAIPQASGQRAVSIVVWTDPEPAPASTPAAPVEATSLPHPGPASQAKKTR